ncbi:hypothetical protein A5761_09805 [Mycolicibacterium setense]|uniref:MaoC family dehydratase N-terminal domain-containing protein n=1 Tax=Mycolicibacterium setense TaxID=431269 RepID=UPI0007E989E6|nr:MaoC family dehydratase N-terminal domain-containing protein [Mycolicibacterium setense]OBB17642.1 hypothetical protein A5761_09805 [Mycolicibacterium setense]
MIDHKVVGTTTPTTTIDIERGQLLLFAKAIGETNPVYLDLEAARLAGHPDLLVPPTFLTGFADDGGRLMDVLIEAGADLKVLLHGEQKFTYHRPTYAGQSLSVESRIGEIYEKKGGALQFVVVDTAVSDAEGAVADVSSVMVFRQPLEVK